jgi:hypothetical protein
VAPPLAVLDTCVLYPRTTRDLLLDYAIEGLFEPLWSEEILVELRRTCVRRNNPVDGGAGLIAALGKVFPDALGTGHQRLVPTLVLPDPDDRHVLALALHHEAEFVVTANLADFPSPLPGGILAISADDFLYRLTDEMPTEALAAAKAHRAQRRLDPADHLAMLMRAGLVKTAAALARGSVLPITGVTELAMDAQRG